jgi:hypothetical protein
MSDGLAKVFIACGAIAAAIGGMGTTLVVVGGPAAGQLVAYAIPVSFLALAYGIGGKRSRICAVIALVAFAWMRINFYRVAAQIQEQRGDHTMTGFWISVSLFILLYALGVVGTFIWNARHPTPSRRPV